MNLCPWADVVYGCDAAWWRHRKGLSEFDGLKICFAGNGMNVDEFPNIRRVHIALDAKAKYSDEIQTEQGTLGSGGNSGFQAINLAMQFGAKKIVLIGFDMDDSGGKHWYGRNRWPGANNPDRYNFMRWLPHFENAAPVIASMGVKVFNASRESALKCFPFKTVEQALAEFDTTRQLDMAGVRSA